MRLLNMLTDIPVETVVLLLIAVPKEMQLHPSTGELLLSCYVGTSEKCFPEFTRISI